jgi:hypothetical protein
MSMATETKRANGVWRESSVLRDELMDNLVAIEENGWRIVGMVNRGKHLVQVIAFRQTVGEQPPAKSEPIPPAPAPIHAPAQPPELPPFRPLSDEEHAAIIRAVACLRGARAGRKVRVGRGALSAPKAAVVLRRMLKMNRNRRYWEKRRARNGGEA